MNSVATAKQTKTAVPARNHSSTPHPSRDVTNQPTIPQEVGNLAIQSIFQAAHVARLGNQVAQHLSHNGTEVAQSSMRPLDRVNEFLGTQSFTSQPIIHQNAGAQSVLDGFGARGAAAGNHILISSRLGKQVRQSVLAHEMTHLRQTNASATQAKITEVGSRHDPYEREATLAGALGVPLQPQMSGANPSIVRLDYDQTELFTTSITPSWAAPLSDQELQQARTALSEQMFEHAEGSAEHDSARDNDRVLAEEISRRGSDDHQRNLESTYMSNRPQGPPVIFGIDNRERRIFASVAATGATLEEVALFIYGSASFVSRLAEDNSLVPGQILPPGTTIRLVEGTVPESAREVLNAGLRSGSIIRTDGIPDTLQDNGDVYTIPIGGRLTQVNSLQFNAVLNGIRRATRIEINRIKGGFEGLLETRNYHASGTNSWVRGISDWRGDVDLPGTLGYKIHISMLKALRTTLDELELSGEPPANARQVQAVQQQLIMASRRLDEMEREWRNYIGGTISGAARTVSTLETVRNFSFAAVAGMAGAVAAPAAFAALGTVGITGGTATALSLGGAALTGGTVRGSLEVISPGAQVQYNAEGEPVDVREDTRGVSQRFADTFYSGAVQGLTGGAGAFLAPVASTAVTEQLVSRYGQAFVQTTTGRLTSQVVTGMAVGAPTSAAGSALELAPSLAQGEISSDQFANSVLTSTLYGTGLGGAFSVLPVNGLYRNSRTGLFRGEAVTPRWMLAGPRSPLARFQRHVPTDHSTAMSTDIPEGFHTLPRDQLPAFVDDPNVAGYAWTRVRSGGVDQWAPVRTYGPQQDFELAWYNTPEGGATTNRVMLYREPNASSVPVRAVGSRATQRPSGNTYAGARRHPEMDFNETMPDGTVVRNVEGHRIDQADTMTPTSDIPNSATSRVNFAPEPPAWGSSRSPTATSPRGHPFQGRNQLTMRMRRSAPGGGTQYSQYEFYGSATRRTADSSVVPERIIFVEHAPDGTVARAWDIPTGSADVQAGVGMRTAGQIDAHYAMDPAFVPQAREINPLLLPPAILGATTAQQMSLPDGETH